jgi:uncharacterized protein (TIGR02271 family)
MAADRNNGPDRNPDPITGAPGSHPTGVGIGAAAGGLTGVGTAVAAGAATGSVAGPIGTAIGAIAGAVVGGYVGKGIGEKHDPTEDDTYWREQHKGRPYVTKEHDYDRDLAPAYRYGSTIGLHENSDHDRPVGSTDAGTASTSGMGVTGSIKAAGTAAAARTPTAGTTPTTTTGTRRVDFDQHEADLRAGWDKVRGTSGLNYDQARHAIRDAYDRRLQLREERLQVGKEKVQTGEASIRKEVITEHHQVDVPLQREELVIERRPATGATAAGAIGEAETIRVPLSEERATVAKNTVVTEEVSIGKKATTNTQTVGADVKKEQLKVDNTGTTGSTGTTRGV